MLTGPRLFLVAGLAYLAASAAAATDPAMTALNERVSVTPLAVLAFLFGLLGYWAGLRTRRLALKLGWIPVAAGAAVGTVSASFILGIGIVPALLLNAAAMAISLVLLFSKLRHEYVFSAGFFLFWLNFLLVGFPVLDPGMHVQLFTVVNPLFVTGFVLMMFALIRLHPQRRALWLLAVLSALVSTYRVYIGIAVITWALLELRGRRRPSGRKLALLAIGLALVAGASVFIGHAVKVESSGSWTLGPVRTLEYRLALTMGVFDDIAGLSFPLGSTFGRSLTMEATEFNCRVLYGCDRRITATAYGEAMLDFGLLGVFLVSWFLAAVLANLHGKDYPLFAFLLASLLVVLDVGINIFLVLQFIYLGWMSLAGEWDASWRGTWKRWRVAWRA